MGFFVGYKFQHRPTAGASKILLVLAVYFYSD